MSEICAISIKTSYDYCVGNKAVIHGHEPGFQFHVFHHYDNSGKTNEDQ